MNFKVMMKQKNNEGLLPLHIALQRANYNAVRIFCEQSDPPLIIDHLCFEKTRIHRDLFDFLHQWKCMENSKTADIYFRFQ
jgi:ankyrin repeat protein